MSVISVSNNRWRYWCFSLERFRQAITILRLEGKNDIILLNRFILFNDLISTIVLRATVELRLYKSVK